jgi:hypothetical protein
VALRRADPQSKESYRLCKKDYENEEDARAQQRAVGPLMNEMTEIISNEELAYIKIITILIFLHKYLNYNNNNNSNQKAHNVAPTT